MALSFPPQKEEKRKKKSTLLEHKNIVLGFQKFFFSGAV